MIERNTVQVDALSSAKRSGCHELESPTIQLVFNDNAIIMISVMTTTLMFLGLLACSYAQLIYPDDSILIRTTTVPPFPSSPTNNKMNPSSNNNVAAPYPYSLPQAPGTRLPPGNSGFGQTQMPPSPPVLSTFTENALQEWSDHVSTKNAENV